MTRTVLEPAGVRAPVIPPGRSLPTVSIVIANLDGERDLPTCLDSIAALEYPAERVETIVVDNGSIDGSKALLAKRYPWVRVLPQETNLGFAPAMNLGVAASRFDVVVLLNNDMQVRTDWLSELVAAYDPAAGVVCVGGAILDWDGSHVDFVDGVLNWHGMGDQVGFGREVGDVAALDGRELLFACGGSMLVDRAVYTDLGGLDEKCFAYFEDVDFGWRLWLSGFRVRLAAKACVQHRHNGTSGRFPLYQRTLLYERNSLRSLIKNLSDENLGRVLGPALLLLVQRMLLDADLDRDHWNFGAPGTDEDSDAIGRGATARMHAVGDLLADIDGLIAERRRVQLGRKVSDEEIFSRFGQPFKPLGAGGEEYVSAAEGVRKLFRLEDVFTAPRATRIAVLAYDRIGERMAGPAVRSWEIASALARICPVTLLSATEVGRQASGVDVVQFSGDDQLREHLAGMDVVLVHGFALQEYPSLRSTRALLAVDLYDPWVFENLEMHRTSEDDRLGDHYIRRDVDVQADLLDRGDFFVCASERQRDYWLGMLTARGRVDRTAYAADPTLRSLIDVLPYGCPTERPAKGEARLRGVHPAVGEDDIIVTWGGGTWDWFDPVLVLESFAKAHEVEPRLRLFFMGLDQAAGAGVPRMRVAQQLRERAEQLGLVDTAVIFGDWAPYDERSDYLAETDIGIIATKDLAEVRLAFRSRLLDHFWMGIPTVATEGDVLSDVVRDADAGIVVPIGDGEALTRALLDFSRDEQRRGGAAERAAALGERYRWTRSVEVLRPILEHPDRWRAMRSQRATRRQLDLTEDTQVLLAHRRRLLDQYEHVEKLLERIRRSRLFPLARWIRDRLKRSR